MKREKGRNKDVELSEEKAKTKRIQIGLGNTKK